MTQTLQQKLKLRTTKIPKKNRITFQIMSETNFQENEKFGNPSYGPRSPQLWSASGACGLHLNCVYWNYAFDLEI